MDSIWVGSAIDRKGTLGCCFSMGSGVISWFGKIESYMVLITTEEKYVATFYLGGSMFLLKTTISFDYSDLNFCLMQRGVVKLQYVIQIKISQKREF